MLIDSISRAGAFGVGASPMSTPLKALPPVLPTRTTGHPAPTDGRALLEHWVASPTTPQRVVLRSRIVLLALEGLTVRHIADRTGASTRSVRLWIGRHANGGAQALLKDAPGRGRHPTLDCTTITDRLREAGLLRADGAPTSLRKAAAHLGGSATAVWRALRRRH